MKYCILLSALLLTGCISEEHDYRVLHPDVAYVGDSLCHHVWDTEKDIKGIRENDDDEETAQNMAGIVSMCVRGRKAVDVESLPDGYRVLFLALGTNDVGRTPIETFRLHYQTLVYNVEAENLYCVLPNKTVNGVDSEPYRDVIRETCANVIDPLSYGVRFRAKDGVHMVKKDHKLWLIALLKVI